MTGGVIKIKLQDFVVSTRTVCGGVYNHDEGTEQETKPEIRLLF